MRSDLRNCVLCVLIIMASCASTRTIIVGESQNPEIDILFAAARNWPEDTTAGAYAAGTARSGESVNLAARSQYNALLRLRGELQGGHGLSLNVSESSFINCIEECAGMLHVKTDSLENGSVRTSVFIGKENLNTIIDCMGR